MTRHLKLTTYQTIDQARKDNPNAYQVIKETSGWFVFETEEDLVQHLTQQIIANK